MFGILNRNSVNNETTRQPQGAAGRLGEYKRQTNLVVAAGDMADRMTVEASLRSCVLLPDHFGSIEGGHSEYDFRPGF